MSGFTFVIGAKDMASKVLSGVGRAIRDTFVVAGGNLLASGITNAMNGLRSLVNMALEAEAANTALDASMRGLGIYTPQLAAQFRDLASVIQDETGVSDEATKSLIAQMLTIGVMPDKIAFAARAVQALTAAGKDNESAMRAVAKMIEGDLSGFEKLSPAVKQATTVSAKFEAIQKLIISGYEQQKAVLLTVGGAWGALKERIGDAVEDMGMAIMKGLGLGETLGGLQQAVGDFLGGEGWAKFVNGLKDGAAAAKEIVVALSNQGGFAASMKGVADIIIAAFMDGAVAAYNAVKKSAGNSGFGQAMGGIGTALKAVWDVTSIPLKALSQAAGSASAGDFSGKSLFVPESKGDSGSNLERVLGKIKGVAALNDLAKPAAKVKDAWATHYARMEELDRTLKGVNEAKKKTIITEKSKQISDMWEAQYTKDKAGREKAKQDAADAAQAKADMLFQEFLDPSKRTSRLDEEKRKADAEAQLQREYADIQKRQETGFGIRNPNEREKQVMELMNARQEVTRSQDEVQRQIEKNTAKLADMLDSLLKIRNG
jgi:hypothetical protein